MKQTIYLDVLFCVNFVIDYLLLLSVGYILSLSAKRIRYTISACVGGLCSFVILLPPMPFWLASIVSVVEAILMTIAAFMPIRGRQLFKAFCVLFIISFCFCGGMLALLTLFSPKNTVVRNSAVYIGVPPLLLVGISLVCYLILRFIYSIVCRGSAVSSECCAMVEYMGKTVTAKGIVDTGNNLHEPFSGDCVIVGREDVFKEMLDRKNVFSTAENAVKQGGVRLIPFSSVGGEGLIPAFKPSGLTIFVDKRTIRTSAYIAVCSEKAFSDGCELLVPGELIVKGS